MADLSGQNSATSQLAAIPFGSLIGGPLVAAIEAQASAAKSTADFILDVAYKPLAEGADPNQARELQTVDFIYSRGTEKASLSVPLLAIVPIPYIRIDTMSINFKANISASSETDSTDTTSTTKTADVSGKASYGVGAFKASAKFNAGFSSKKDSTSSANSKYSVEYTMDIAVHASQDDIPAGMSRVLNMLQESIQSTPQSTPESTPESIPQSTPQK
jgi:hypothetical protein